MEGRATKVGSLCCCHTISANWFPAPWPLCGRLFQLVCGGGGRRWVLWETRRGRVPCPPLPQQLCPERTAVTDPSDAPNAAYTAAVGVPIWEHNWTQRVGEELCLCGDVRAASTHQSGLQGYRSFGDIGNKWSHDNLRTQTQLNVHVQSVEHQLESSQFSTFQFNYFFVLIFILFIGLF